MSAWILRSPFHRPTIGGPRPVVVLHVTAEGEETELEVLELGPESLSAKDLFQGELQKGHRRLILDLCGTDTLNASAIVEILVGWWYLRDSGDELVLANVDPRVREGLRAYCIEYTPLFDSVEAAARHFGS